MKIKPEQLPPDITSIVETLRSSDTCSQTIYSPRTNALLVSYINGPTLNSVTIAAEDVTGRKHEARFTFNEDDSIKHIKTPKELSCVALKRYFKRTKRYEQRASQAETATSLVLRAGENIS